MASRVGYLGLGSNVGDRASHLRAALDLLGENGVEVEAARRWEARSPTFDPSPR